MVWNQDSSASNRGARKVESGRLRAMTDAGMFGDKVAHFDPAAAPLGTDEEAGGTPTLVDDVEDSILRQRKVATESIVRKARMLGVAIIAGGIGVTVLIVWALITWMD